MGWQTTVPDALARLAQIAGEAPELEGVTVRDGPAIEDATVRRVLYIGWSGGTEDTDVEAQVAGEGLGGTRDQEQATIRCTAWVSAGETDVPPVRAAAYAIVSGLGAALDRDRTLGGAVMRVSMGGHTLTQQQTSRGAQAAISFEVNTDGYTKR